MKRPWLGAGVILFGFCQAAISQEDCGKDPLFQETQRKETLTDEDDKTLDRWLDCSLVVLESELNVANPPNNRAKAATAFVDTYVSFFQLPEVMAAFRDRLTIRTAARFGAEVEKLGNPDAVRMAIVRNLAFALRQAAHPASISALEKGLALPDQATRFYCVAGYRVLLPTLALDATAAKAALAVLQKAGTAESNPVILGEIYRALRVPTLIADVSEVMANILASRLDRVQKGFVIRDYSEVDAYLFLLDQRAQVPDPQKEKIVRSMAVLMKYDLETRQAGQFISFIEKSALTARIKAAEDLLQVLVQPATRISVTDALKNNSDPFVELAKWVGAADVEGVLNSAPWNLPRGGEAEAPVPEEKPAGEEDKS